MGANKSSKKKPLKQQLDTSDDAEVIEPSKEEGQPSVEEAAVEPIPETTTGAVVSEVVSATDEVDEKKSENHPHHHYSRKQKLLFAAFGVVVLLGLALTRMYVAKTSLNKVTIAGIPAGRSLQPTTLEPQLNQKAAQFKIKIAHPNAEVKSFSLKEAGLAIDMVATINQARQKQQTTPFVHRLQFWRTQDLPAVMKVDETLFSAFILAETSDVSKPAQSAAMTIEAGKLKVTPSSSGQGYQIRNARQTILDGVSLLKAVPFQMEAREIKPSVPDANLDAAKKKVSSILAQDVTLTINGKIFKASPTDIGAWIELTPVESENTIDVTVDSGKVVEYLTALTKPYTSGQRAQVVSTAADGSTVILVQGQNGVDVQKKDAVAAEIAKKLLAGEGVTIDVPISTAPFKTVTAQAYDKWIAVDVTAKRLYAYEKTNLMRTVLVSAGAPGTPTVLGQYNIYSKFSKQDMRGQNVDGSRYFQPNVPWVNYFYKDYAIHGNYWRPASYFGNINSSHGCVGVQNVDGEWIYNWAPIATPVIVYN